MIYQGRSSLFAGAGGADDFHAPGPPRDTARRADRRTGSDGQLRHPGGKAEAQSALGQIYVIRTTLAEVANIDDFRDDLDAPKRTLLAYLLT